MTAQEKLKKFKSLPSTIIVNGLSVLGINLAKSLLEQRGFVIIVDEYTEDNKDKIEELSNYESFTFIDKNGVQKFADNVKHLDYLIYLDNENLSSGDEYSPNQFLKKCNEIDEYFKLALEKKSKVLLSTSFETHQASLNEAKSSSYIPKQAVYTDIELQRYKEKLAFDYHNKYKLDVRILRIAQIYGPGCSLKKQTTLNSLIQQSLRSKILTIKGDGLEENYFIHIYDATYGVIKALFSSQTNGEIFNLVNIEDNTTLSIAYALIETDAKAKQVKFIEEDYKGSQAPIDETPNLSNIGWRSRIELAQGLLETVSSLQGKEQEKKIEKKEIDTKKKQSLSKFQKGVSSKLTSRLDRAKKFFTTSKEQQLAKPKEERKGILAKLSKPTVDKKRLITHKELSQKLKGIKKGKFTKPKLKAPKIPIIKYKRYIKSNTVKLAYTSLAIVLFYFFIFEPVIGFTGNLLLSALDTYKVASALQSSNYQSLEGNLSRLDSHIDKAHSNFNKFHFAFGIAGRTKTFENISTLFESIGHLAKGGEYSATLISAGAEYASNFSIDTTRSSDHTQELQTIVENSANLELAYIELLKAKNQLEKVDFNKIPLVKNKEGEITSLQQELFSRLINYKDFVSTLPSLVGYGEDKQYLLIFQNSTELRSTGGFIGSYAIINFSQGNLTQLTIDDIYNPDGQLKTFVEPPQALKEIVGEESWAMRDANWEPDFPTSAKQIQWFYELETGNKVDGVIAINSMIMEDLLEITGPIYVESIGRTISTDNFFEEAQQHHLDFVPGSTEKKDFLGSLATALLSDIASRESKELLSGLGKKIEGLLNSREVFIYLNDPNAQRLIAKNNWDGSLDTTNGDYLFTVENNLAGNKVNRYIEKTVSQKIVLGEDGETHDLEIKVLNKSKSNEWPGGTYKHYLMMFIPSGSTNINADGLTGQSIEQKYGYTVVQGFVEVAPQKLITVKLSYDTKLLEKLPLGKQRYDLLIQKQAGVEETYIDLTINYPNGWTVESESADISGKEGINSLSYYGLQNDDVNVEVTFLTE